MKNVLMVIVLCIVASSLIAYEAKKPIFIKGPTKEDQKALKSCAYYIINAADGGFNYTCINLSKGERDWIVKTLNKRTLYDRTIDDKLIDQLTMPKNDLNTMLKQVLTDFKGRSVKKVLRTLKKPSTMQKFADVLAGQGQY